MAHALMDVEWLNVGPHSHAIRRSVPRWPFPVAWSELSMRSQARSSEKSVPMSLMCQNANLEVFMQVASPRASVCHSGSLHASRVRCDPYVGSHTYRHRASCTLHGSMLRCPQYNGHGRVNGSKGRSSCITTDTRHQLRWLTLDIETRAAMIVGGPEGRCPYHSCFARYRLRWDVPAMGPGGPRVLHMRRRLFHST